MNKKYDMFRELMNWLNEYAEITYATTDCLGDIVIKGETDNRRYELRLTVVEEANETV